MNDQSILLEIFIRMAGGAKPSDAVGNKYWGTSSQDPVSSPNGGYVTIDSLLTNPHQFGALSRRVEAMADVMKTYYLHFGYELLNDPDAK